MNPVHAASFSIVLSQPEPVQYLISANGRFSQKEVEKAYLSRKLKRLNRLRSRRELIPSGIHPSEEEKGAF